MQEWFNVYKSINIIDHINKRKNKNHITSVDVKNRLENITDSCKNSKEQGN